MPKSKAIDDNSHLEFKKAIAAKIHAKDRDVRAWFIKNAEHAAVPFYCSVDLRDAGNKIVPVDSNMYPAGFNNICPDDQRLAPVILKAKLLQEAKQAGITEPRRVLILPESHTSNSYYIENLYYLEKLIKDAGFETRIGWLGSNESDTAIVELRSASEKTLHAYPIRVDGKLCAGDFVPDLIVLNNDFSGGYPDLLDRVSQPILPSHRLGWHTRKKSEHFRHYNRLAAEFAAIVGIDPWVLQIETESVDNVNFNEDQGIEAVALATERVLENTRRAYAERKITSEPFVFVKNNSGTYGMGIMVVHSADEVRKMNRRSKNKMSVGKNKKQIESVCVQEGIPTSTLVDRLAAEPVIYLVGCELIGGFLRTNTERGIEENLNSQGMVFRKLCMSDLREDPDDAVAGEAPPALELVYGSIARISALATGYELKDRLSS